MSTEPQTPPENEPPKAPVVPLPLWAKIAFFLLAGLVIWGSKAV